MNKELNYIKKKYGEKMAHLCRDLFPTILETEGLLTQFLTNSFNQSKYLYDDIVSNDVVEDFRNFINKKFNLEFEEIVPTDKSPEELMNEAGYVLYECKTEEDIQSFKKYYAPGEELCTFWGGRLDSCHVFFAVKKNVDEIRRADFTNPKRQDEYGTSVISIQFSRNKPHYLSIKNRYNHTVPNCDSTFSNNLENIIPGLTYSFERFYGINYTQKKKIVSDFEIPGYREANDGRIYKYNQEINNVLYCPDNIIIDNGEVKKFDKSRYLIVDYFIFDFKEKKVTTYGGVPDALPETLGTIIKMEVVSTDDTKEIIIESKEYGTITIKLDKLNQLIGYTNTKIEKIEDDCFLSFNKTLEEISIPKVKHVGNHFLEEARSLKEFTALELEEIFSYFLRNALSLLRINIPKAKEMGMNSLENAPLLQEFIVPNLENADRKLLNKAESLRIFNAPKLKELPHYSLNIVPSLISFKGYSIESLGDDTLAQADSLQELYIPNCKRIFPRSLRQANSLKALELPFLEKVDFESMQSLEALEVLIANNLKAVEYNNLMHIPSLKRVSFPELEKAGNNFFRYCDSLEAFDAPKLKTLGVNSLAHINNLKALNCPSLETVDNIWLLRVKALMLKYKLRNVFKVDSPKR